MERSAREVPGGRRQNRGSKGSEALREDRVDGARILGSIARGDFHSRFVHAAGHRIHYRVGGDGPPVVLVHGYGVASSYMMPLAEQLIQDFRVYVPELPGFGESSKPADILDVRGLASALHHWMQEVGVEKPALVGNSLGCQIIVRLLEAMPDAAACAVLQGPSVDRAARSAARQIVRLLLDSRYERTSLGLIIARDYAKAGPRRLIRTLQYMLADDIENALPHVFTPTLVVRGSRDVVVPERWAREVVDRLPNGQYRLIAGAPHAANYSAPHDVARVTRPFLRRHLS